MNLIAQRKIIKTVIEYHCGTYIGLNIYAFNNLIVSFPKSIATVYISRHAIEIG